MLSPIQIWHVEINIVMCLTDFSEGIYPMEKDISYQYSPE